jgi:hypothetical protein
MSGGTGMHLMQPLRPSVALLPPWMLSKDNAPVLQPNSLPIGVGHVRMNGHYARLRCRSLPFNCVIAVYRLRRQLPRLVNEHVLNKLGSTVNERHYNR